MSKEYNGGPAFPCDNIVERNDKGQLQGHEVSTFGISVRDYFAAEAMQMKFGSPGSSMSMGRMAAECYEMADAMLEARKS